MGLHICRMFKFIWTLDNLRHNLRSYNLFKQCSERLEQFLKHDVSFTGGFFRSNTLEQLRCQLDDFSVLFQNQQQIEIESYWWWKTFKILSFPIQSRSRLRCLFALRSQWIGKERILNIFHHQSDSISIC